MTKVEELKKMYENMGGDPEAVADKTLITEMLDAMSELELSELPEVTAEDNGDVLTVVDGVWGKSAPASSGLPEVTAADNGDVLSVVEGAWAKAAPAENTAIFNAILSTSGSGTIMGTLSDGKTYSDIHEAFQSGKLITLRATGALPVIPDALLILNLSKAINNGSTDILYFDVVTLDHNTNVAIYYTSLNMSSTTGTTFTVFTKNVTTT